MRKTKLTAILMAICCVFAVLGFGINLWSTNKTAKATDVPTVTVASEVWDSSATGFYMATRGTVEVEGNWDDAVFVLASGTGNGATLNESALAGFRMRKIDVYWLENEGTVGLRWYVDFTTEAVAGDKLVIDGTYHLSSDSTKAIDFDNVTFEYDGAKWLAVSTSELHQVGKLTPGNVDTATNMYFNLENGIPSEDVSWEIPYVAEDAVVTINESPVTIGLKVVNNAKAYLEFAQAPQEGDVLVIEGTFACEALASKINIAQSKFVWNGEAWEIVHVIHEIGALELHGNSKGVGGAAKRNDVIYLTRVDGQALPVLSWEDAFVADSAENFKINGEPVTPTSIKSTGDGFYWEFGALNANDYISISGTFTCASKGVRYVIEESRFTWTGDKWEPYVEYTTYELGQVAFLKVHSETQQNFVYFYRADGESIPMEITPNSDLAWNTWFYVLSGSGEGITLNGAPAELGIKFPGDIFFEFAQVPQEGDVLVVECTLYSAELATKYEIERSEFVWKNGGFISMLEHEKSLLKEELNEYYDNFVEDNYYDAEWELLSQRLADGMVAIDEASDLDGAEEALANAKASLDEVLTKEEVDAIIDEARTSAKAELTAYVSEEDYHDAEWAQIQAIITQANDDIEACQSVSGLATIVADAKEEIDGVKTAEEVDAEALVNAKTQAKAEVREYYNALDLDSYSDDANAELSALVTTANTAIDNATTVEEVQTAVSQFKTGVDAVEKLSTSTSTGCAGSVGGLIALTPALALALGMIIRKKRED